MKRYHNCILFFIFLNIIHKIYSFKIKEVNEELINNNHRNKNINKENNHDSGEIKTSFNSIISIESRKETPNRRSQTSSKTNKSKTSFKTNLVFESMVNKLKQTVVMIDINSDLQFFDETSTTSKATGFIVNKELGLIATNKHVTRISPTTHKINFLNGAVEKGTVVYYDFFHDFGFIQLDSAKDPDNYKQSELYKSLTAVELGSSYDLKVNDDLMLIGNNEGVSYSIKYGTVSSINVADFNGLGSIILTNFDRTGGSSGSPVWNANGKVVAIHAMGNKEGSFEVPIDYLKDVLDSYANKLKSGEKTGFFDYDKGFVGAFYALVPQFKVKNMHVKFNNLNANKTIKNDILIDKEEAEKNEKQEIDEFYKSLKNYQRDSEEQLEVIQINSVIPTISNQNNLKSGDVIMKVNERVIGNDLVLLEKILNENILRKVSMKILRFGKIVNLDNVKVSSTHKEKVFRFLKIANTILHDVNLYIKLFNPLIPEGIVISKIGLGSPFNEIGVEAQLLLSAFNSKKVSSIDEFIEEFKNNKSGNSENIDVMDLKSTSFKAYNYIIDFGNIQEIYLYEFDSTQGIWNKKIIKIAQKPELSNRTDYINNKIVNYEKKHLNYSQINNLRTEYSKLFNK